ncbi:MAG TPA: HPr kinase/phosphatase C-terminal domain-containing protein [Rhizomicrobium sp.]
MIIHASCVLLGRAAETFDAPPGAGILIVGESGSGKSGLALRLIERGAVLISDDRTDLLAQEGNLWARAPAALAGLLEVRGLGIIELNHATEARIQLAVQLCTRSDVVRLPEPACYEAPVDLNIRPECRPPLLRLAAEEASAPAMVLAAAAAHAKALFRNQCNPV